MKFSFKRFPALLLLFFILAPFILRAQIIDQDHIKTLIEDGNTDKAIQNLEHFLSPKVDLSQGDSVFALKTLGMINAQRGKLQQAKTYFKNLFVTDPTASIRNTDASYAIIEVFLAAKNEFKKEHGGEILRPVVIVMNPLGQAIEDKYRGSIARQFIEELQRLWLFEPMNWDDVQGQLKADRMDPTKCENEACYTKMAKNLEGDKVVLLYFEKVDKVYSLILKYIDVQTGKPESILKRSSVNNLDTLILTGLQELAIELEQENAAWLQFSLEPPNAYLELNNSATDGERRIPVMPGKHKICASATGFVEECKTIEVKPRDGLTHRLALKPEFSKDAEKVRQNTDGQNTDEKSPEIKSFSTELYILGGLAVLALGLVILFSR